VTTDHAGFLDRIVAVLSEADVRYCVIGGQAVNAYVEPVVSLDLDIAVAIEDLEATEALLREHFKGARFPAQRESLARRLGPARPAADRPEVRCLRRAGFGS
jgi:hypothetical protein